MSASSVQPVVGQFEVRVLRRRGRLLAGRILPIAEVRPISGVFDPEWTFRTLACLPVRAYESPSARLMRCAERDARFDERPLPWPNTSVICGYRNSKALCTIGFSIIRPTL
jgi:hypothetical protein